MSIKDDLAMVKEYGYNLQYVQEQAPEICFSAVQQDGNALEFVKEQTPEVCLAAVQQNGWSLRYVKDQTPAICLAAVQKNRAALCYVNDLHSIADEIDESTITKGLDSGDEEVVLAYQKLVKIREANAITKRINKSVSTVNHSPKFKL